MSVMVESNQPLLQHQLRWIRTYVECWLTAKKRNFQQVIQKASESRRGQLLLHVNLVMSRLGREEEITLEMAQSRLKLQNHHPQSELKIHVQRETCAYVCSEHVEQFILKAPTY